MRRIIFLMIAISGCAGLKVVNPNENKGTLAVDTKDGKLKLVETYTCKLSSMGNRFSAVGKSEAEAREEVVARCRDKTLLSFCKSEDAKCEKN